MKAATKTKKAYMAAWRQRNKKHLRAYYAQYHRLHRDNRRAQCRAWRRNHLAHARAYDRRSHREHAQEENAQNVLRRSRIKKAVLAFYGGRCAGCGIDDTDVLTLDHINGDGNVERSRGKTGSGSPFYAFLFKGMKLGKPKRRDLRVLCANCQLRAVKYGGNIATWPKQEQKQGALTAEGGPVTLTVLHAAGRVERPLMRTA